LTPDESPESTEPGVPDAKFSKHRAALAWTGVLCWGALIWILGGDSFSFFETSDAIFPWLDWLTGDLDYRTRYRILVAIRNAAHFIEYAILALLTFRAALLAARKTQFATAGWIALFIVTSLASADEARQAFSPVRTGSPYDILLDVSGGLIAVIGVLIISRRLRGDDQIETSE
jgi:VanZ family protein